ncbi:helix-turn-helix domain-containing protein [Actinacidiphila rubida]|uniref:Helix-turn-helix domain-containing protein n=1 Tax=Actinacidiphila rubida TaxID=310780 RepID=A0A1H8PWW2_9ACTN|nr:helix-turn-helix transcriptional regulator [Actinacidiphila rubida]SEO46296.1 Helix-turn-helix domain-containing protein [Actinacidiphila rubida]
MAGRPSAGQEQHLKGARLGMRLRTLREERGWTHTQLADAAGVSRRTLKRIEIAGSAAPGLFTIAALADALGVTVDALVAYAHGSGTDDGATGQ